MWSAKPARTSVATPQQMSTPRGRRIPASDIESLVTDRIRAWLASPASLVKATGSGKKDITSQKRLIDQAAQRSRQWPELAPARQRAILSMLVARIDVRPDSVDIHLLPSHLPRVLADSPADQTKPNLRSPTMTLSVRVQLQRTGLEMRLLIEGEHAREPDRGLIKLLIKARAYAEQLASGSAQSLEDIATHEHVTCSYVTRVLRVAFVAPDIAAAILRGQHPPQLNTAKLLANSRLPLAWSQQRDALGFS